MPNHLQPRQVLFQSVILVTGIILAACTPLPLQPTTPTIAPTFALSPPATASPTETVLPSPTSTVIPFFCGIGLEDPCTPTIFRLDITQTPNAITETPINELPPDKVMTEIGSNDPWRFPEHFMDNSKVKAQYNQRVEWLKKLGFDTDNPNSDKYRIPKVFSWGTGNDFRYTWAIVDMNNNVAGWMQIKDDSKSIGWRWSNGPTWDTNYKVSDTVRFELPTNINDGSSYGLSLNGEHILLTLFDNKKQPIMVLNPLSQKLEYLEGVNTDPPYTVVECKGISDDITNEFLKRAKNLPDSRAVNILENGQPVPDGYWFDLIVGSTNGDQIQRANITGTYLGVMDAKFKSGGGEDITHVFGIDIQIKPYTHVIYLEPASSDFLSTRGFYLIPDDYIPNENQTLSPKSKWFDTFDKFYAYMAKRELIGQQIVFQRNYNLSGSYIGNTEYMEMSHINDIFVTAMKNGTVPHIPSHDCMYDILMRFTFGFPEKVISTIKE